MAVLELHFHAVAEVAARAACIGGALVACAVCALAARRWVGFDVVYMLACWGASAGLVLLSTCPAEDVDLDELSTQRPRTRIVFGLRLLLMSLSMNVAPPHAHVVAALFAAAIMVGQRRLTCHLRTTTCMVTWLVGTWFAALCWRAWELHHTTLLCGFCWAGRHWLPMGILFVGLTVLLYRWVSERLRPSRTGGARGQGPTPTFSGSMLTFFLVRGMVETAIGVWQLIFNIPK